MVRPADPVADLRLELEAVSDPERARQMAAYMKHRFPFLGVAAAERRRVARPLLALGRSGGRAELLALTDELWAQPEREFHHTAVDLLRRGVDSLEAEDLPRVERLIRTNSWWDTVDALAAHVVGGLVARHPALVSTMDRWVVDDDIWIARTAILHQLAFGERCDARRLFDYVDRRCTDSEFFIRKACGWALRQHARHDPDAVREYVASRGDRLSGLTRREAMKHL